MVSLSYSVCAHEVDGEFRFSFLDQGLDFFDRLLFFVRGVDLAWLGFGLSEQILKRLPFGASWGLCPAGGESLPSIQVGKNGSLGVGPVGLAVSVDVHLYGGVGCVSDQKKSRIPMYASSRQVRSCMFISRLNSFFHE
jgi:hypothetical protein